MDYIHIVALTILFLTAVLLGRMLSASILHPIRIFSIIWCVFTLIPLLVWDVGYQWTFYGLYWIAAAALAMELGGLLAKKCYMNSHWPVQGDTAATGEKDTNVSWMWLVAVLGAGLLYVVVFLAVNGIRLSSITSFQNVLDINAAAAQERYFGDGGNVSMLSQILLTAVYMGSACGGYVFNFTKSIKQKVLSLLTLLPIMASTLLENTKAGFIASAFLWFAGWAISYAYIQGSLPVVSGRLMRRLVLLGVAFIGILYFVMLLRVGDFSAPMREVIYNKLLHYAFGQMIQFDGWFHGEAELLAAGYGMNTYMWLPNLLGFTERVQGVYVSYVTEFGSNIFTVFRGILEDFGFVGGLFYMMFRGFLLEFSLCRISYGKQRRPFSLVLALCGYIFVLYGFIISPWIYTSYALAMIGFGVFVVLFHSKLRIRL